MQAHTPGWTDNREELLKKLWADGLSAGQISTRLGGVTRSAVLGKVHRLGLMGRTKQRATVPAQRLPRVRVRYVHLAPKPKRPRQVFTAVECPPAAMTQIQVVRAIASRVSEETGIPAALRIDLLDLRECMCRWPIGDPKEESFHFCGRAKADLISYCDAHARIAYAPSARRWR